MIFSMLLFDLFRAGREGAVTAGLAGAGTGAGAGGGMVAGEGVITVVDSGSGLGAGRGRRGGGGRLWITTGGGEDEGMNVCSMGSGTATSGGKSRVTLREGV